MATHWATETKDKVNYTRLCRLLYDGGTLAVRTVFDGICLPVSLGATLKTNQHKLQTLKKPTGKPPAKRSRSGNPKVLNQDQWDLLYPPSGASPKSEDFDITLLFVLLRNICGLTPPSTGWDALPPSKDTSFEASLIRIKFYRNKVIAHSSKAEIDDTLFEAHWSDISDAVVSLGLKKDDIDELKSTPIGAKDYNQLVESWYSSDTEIKHQLETIKADTSEIKSDTAEMKSELSDIKSRLPSTQSEITKLAHVDFTSLIQKSCGVYHQSTRQWILDQVEENVETPTVETSVVLIRASPGMGKSVVAAKICEIYKMKGFLGGCHFFQHSNSLRNNPRLMLQSIARQLCNSVNGYQAALETKLKTHQGKNISDLNCEELFGLLFEEPLSQISIDNNVVIVIDALDECASQFKEEIEDVLKRKLCDLPLWIRFVITTRPLPSCRNLSHVVQIEIDSSESRNLQDLKEFFSIQLANRNVHQHIDKLMEISKGLFLVAHFVIEILDDEGGHKSIPEVLECFPHGLSSVYEYYFKRIQKIIKPYIHISESENPSFFKMLEAMVAAKSPIPKKMFYEILQLKNVEEVQRAKRMERNDAVHLLHTIFPLENDHVSVFHKSVTDWLILHGEYEHQFSVSASNGCEDLARKSLDVLKAFKNTAKEGRISFDQPLVLSDSETFSLRYGLEYIDKSSKLSQFEKEEIIYDFIIFASIVSQFYQFEHIDFKVFEWEKLLVRLYRRSPFFRFMSIYRQSYNAFVPYNYIQKPFFRHCLSIVGDVCTYYNIDILPTAQKQELLRLRINQKLPHYTFHSVFPSRPLDDGGDDNDNDDDDDGDDDIDNGDDDNDNDAFQHQTFPSPLDLYQITNGFVAVHHHAQLRTSTVRNIKDDGSLGEHKTFSLSQLRGISPDKKFLIITKTNSSKLELFDVTTLEKVREYNCPVNRVASCHIFGDEQWYIVMKAEGDPKIYILDGLNGQLHDTIKVDENEKIEGVSQCGHILISDTFIGGSYLDHIINDTFKGPMAWLDTGNQQSHILIRKISTIHFQKTDEKIYYCLSSKCNLFAGKPSMPMVFKFSDDGKYFAIYYDSAVKVFQTNDGTLLNIVDEDEAGPEIVFLSFPLLITRSFPIYTSSFLKFYDFVNNKVIYVAPINLPRQYRLLVPSHHHANKSIISLFALDSGGLVKYEFHNLEQNL